MTFRTSVAVFALAASAAWAQSIKTPINLATGAANAVSQKAHEANEQLEAAQQPSTPQPGVPALRPRNGAPRIRQVNRTAKNEAVRAALEKAEQQPTATTVKTRANKRDPFISIIRSEGSPAAGPQCSAGKKCLMISQIVLRGIVRAPSGNIAVVENAGRRTYFLRVSDPVYNGEVVRITADTVVFRERSYDRAGRQTSREVVRTVGPSTSIPEGFARRRPSVATGMTTTSSTTPKTIDTAQVSENVN